jgi:NAD(P)-dependent dehydrogenase (short-subunit alcohol dehydrogenase family)
MLENKVVAISGATGRIGSAFARAVVENNGYVILGDISEDAGKKLVDELGPENAVFFKADLTIPEKIDDFISVGIKKFSRIDAAVHSAYPRSQQWGTCFENLHSEFLKEDLHGQLGGAILFSQRVIKHFTEQGHGHLILLSSIQGIAAPKFEHYEGTAMVSPIEYSAIKAGIIAVSRYLARYCQNKDIRVNCISPGGILDNQPEEFLKRYRNSCTSKGMLNASDLSGTLLYLLSEHSKYLNGQNLVVDDGWGL